MRSYPKSIIFDLDGTLIDSVPAIRKTLNNIFSSEAGGELAIDEVKTLVGFGAKWMIAEVIKRKNIATSPNKFDELMARYYEEYLQVSDQFTEVYDGVVDVLNDLKKLKIKMGVCTNKPGTTTLAVLESLQLSKFFDAIVTEDDVEHRKPDPRHLFHTIKAIDSDPLDTVFVGDSETDMETARRAGVKSIFVTYGYCHVPFSEIRAAQFIEHFSDLPEALAKTMRQNK